MKMGVSQDQLRAKPRYGKSLRLALLGLLLPLSVGACSTLEDTYSDIMGTSDQPTMERVDAGDAGQETSYPNLGSVPNDRPVATSASQRAALQEGLRKNREAAVYVDAERQASELMRSGDRSLSRDSRSIVRGAAVGGQSPSGTGAMQDQPEDLPQDSGGADRKLNGQTFVPGTVSGQAAGGQTAGVSTLALRNDLVGVIYFGHSASDLEQSDLQVLAEIAAYQQKYNGTLRIVGNASQRTNTTDPVARNLANFDISLQRAQSVASALKKLGGSGKQMVVEANSANQPVYYEFMPTGEAGNRRTEIYLQY